MPKEYTYVIISPLLVLRYSQGSQFLDMSVLSSALVRTISPFAPLLGIQDPSKVSITITSAFTPPTGSETFPVVCDAESYAIPAKLTEWDAYSYDKIISMVTTLGHYPAVELIGRLSALNILLSSHVSALNAHVSQYPSVQISVNIINSQG